MPSDHLVTIEKGRTGTIELTVDGIPLLEGLLVKFVASKKFGDDPVIDLDGILDSDGRTISFDYVFDTASSLTAGQYYYEIIIYTADKTYVSTGNNGSLRIKDVILIDPTA
jgi:hypothetical protein